MNVVEVAYAARHVYEAVYGLKCPFLLLIVMVGSTLMHFWGSVCGVWPLGPALQF